MPQVNQSSSWLQHVLSVFEAQGTDSQFEDGEFDKGNGKGGSDGGGKGGGKNGKPFKNLDPEAVDDTGFTVASNASGFSYSVLLNDSDPNGDPLSVSGVDTTNTIGDVHMHADGTFDYDPGNHFSDLAEGEVGYDTFDYVVSDGRGGTSKATVEIAIVGSGDSGSGASGGDPDNPGSPPPYYVDALIRGVDWRLNPEDPVGTATTVTFAFADSVPEYYDDGSFVHDNFTAFDDGARQTTREALQKFADIAGLSFVETTVDDADMVIGAADLGYAGFAYFPDANTVGDRAADVWLDNVTLNSGLEEGSDGYRTLIHEIGHALGLTHPTLPGEEETQQYTMMDSTAHPTFAGDPETPMLFDVAALQWLYGENTDHASEDTVYDYADLHDNQVTIWDGGGVDTIDMSDAGEGVTLNLNQGAFSSVATQGSNNVAIAFGAEIENAIGSAHDDVIVGNELDNHLTGGDGNDIFKIGSESGNDTVSDFQNGLDKIDLFDSGLAYADLSISSVEEGTLISHGTGTFTLLDIEAELVDEDDFLLF